MVPTLNSYRYRLFTVRHGVGLYPVTIVPESGLIDELWPNCVDIVAEAEDELAAILKKIFGARRTDRIVSALRRLATPRSQKGKEESNDFPF
jgi:hypothetical protein